MFKYKVAAIWCGFLGIGLADLYGVEHEVGLQPQVILEEAANSLAPTGTFIARLAFDEYINREKSGELRTLTLARPDDAGHTVLTIIVSPAEESGKMLLMDENSIHFKSPTADRSVKISAAFKVFGRLKVRDLLSLNLLRYYVADEITTAVSPLRQAANGTSWQLHLQRKPGAPVMESIVLWLSKPDRLPELAKTYGAGQRLRSAIVYRDYRQLLGRQRPSRIEVIDGNQPELVTQIRILEMLPAKLPAAWFTREGLPDPQNVFEKLE